MQSLMGFSAGRVADTRGFWKGAEVSDATRLGLDPNALCSTRFLHLLSEQATHKRITTKRCPDRHRDRHGAYADDPADNTRQFVCVEYVQTSVCCSGDEQSVLRHIARASARPHRSRHVVMQSWAGRRRTNRFTSTDELPLQAARRTARRRVFRNDNSLRTRHRGYGRQCDDLARLRANAGFRVRSACRPLRRREWRGLPGLGWRCQSSGWRIAAINRAATLFSCRTGRSKSCSRGSWPDSAIPWFFDFGVMHHDVRAISAND